METFSRLDSVLLLSSVNLPGGELVKKSLLFCSCFVVAYHFDPIFFSHVLHNHTKTTNLTNYSEKLFSPLRDRQIEEERQREREREGVTVQHIPI